jgi:dTDP-4-amino-4,6-dideoxygalactose transaminase
MNPQLQAPTRKVPFSPPDFGPEEIEAAVATLRSDWVTTGPQTHQFEAEFAARVGAPAALALNSCTAGLHLALLTLGIGPGDKVATTTMTFAASVNVIEHVGATPVLVDVEPDTLNMSPKALARVMAPDVRAIIVVHYAGHPADLDAIAAIARAHDVPIVEDAAHALPAQWRNRSIGSHGNLAAFSFYATKNMSTCEGGMLTGPPELLEQARVLHLHGMSKDAVGRYRTGSSWRYDVLAPGFKYNMTDLQASLGRVQLRRLDAMHARRQELAARYDDMVAQLPGLTPLAIRPSAVSAHHLYVIRLDPAKIGIGRDGMFEALANNGVSTSVHFIPIHLHPYYRSKYGHEPEDFPVAYRAFQQMLSLPLFSRMTDEQNGYVRQTIARVIDQASR